MGSRVGGCLASLPPDRYNRVSVLELTNDMKNVLLRNTDAMRMANSLEVRVLYLHDPHVGWALPVANRLRSTTRDDVGAALTGLWSFLAELLDRKAVAGEWRRSHDRRSGWLRPWALHVYARRTAGVGPA